MRRKVESTQNTEARMGHSDWGKAKLKAWDGEMTASREAILTWQGRVGVGGGASRGPFRAALLDQGHQPAPEGERQKQGFWATGAAAAPKTRNTWDKYFEGKGGTGGITSKKRLTNKQMIDDERQQWWKTDQIFRPIFFLPRSSCPGKSNFIHKKTGVMTNDIFRAQIIHQMTEIIFQKNFQQTLEGNVFQFKLMNSMYLMYQIDIYQATPNCCPPPPRRVSQ